MNKCNIDKCINKYYAKGYCEKHYARVRRNGDLVVRSKSTHSMSGSKIFWVWAAMIDRCNNPNNKRYNRYGGRGIKVCKEWLGTNGFQNFYTYIGDKPFSKTLDRINNDGDYEPGNVRWADYYTQRVNRDDVIVLSDGTLLMDYVAATGKKRCAVYSYFRRHGEEKMRGFYGLLSTQNQ